MTPRNTKRQRLESAGYTFKSGWLPIGNPAARMFGQQVEMHRDDVERIAETGKPSGRPKKQPD